MLEYMSVSDSHAPCIMVLSMDSFPERPHLSGAGRQPSHASQLVL